MGVNIQTIKDIRFYLAGELKDVYQESDIRILADILIKAATGIVKVHQLYDGGFLVSVIEKDKIIAFANELKTGKPVQYVVGETTFYNCRIKLNSSTLIPRPETEELVDLIIKENRGCKGDIIDFGSGSGCISIALSANLPESHVTGVEISDEANECARENAVLNNVNVSFLNGDIFNFDSSKAGGVSIIVSNPPYVMRSEKTLMNRNVLDFEPESALFVPDTDPLIYYKAIIDIADKILIPGGRIYFEINEAMGGPMLRLLESYNYIDTKIIADINGKDRIIKGIKYG